jgi:hypothetical protein
LVLRNIISSLYIHPRMVKTYQNTSFVHRPFPDHCVDKGLCSLRIGHYSRRISDIITLRFDSSALQILDLVDNVSMGVGANAALWLLLRRRAIAREGAENSDWLAYPAESPCTLFIRSGQSRPCGSPHRADQMGQNVRLRLRPLVRLPAKLRVYRNFLTTVAPTRTITAPIQIAIRGELRQ